MYLYIWKIPSFRDDNCIIDARNIVTGDKIPYHKTINKYIVKVDPLRAIL